MMELDAFFWLGQFHAAASLLEAGLARYGGHQRLVDVLGGAFRAAPDVNRERRWLDRAQPLQIPRPQFGLECAALTNNRHAPIP